MAFNLIRNGFFRNLILFFGTALAVFLVCDSIESKFHPMVPGGHWEYGFPFVYASGSSIPIHFPDGTIGSASFREQWKYYADLGFRAILSIGFFIFMKFLFFSGSKIIGLASRYFLIFAITCALVPVWLGNYASSDVRAGFPFTFLIYLYGNDRGHRGDFLPFHFILDLFSFVFTGIGLAFFHSRFFREKKGSHLNP